MSVKALSREVVVRMPYWSDPEYPGLSIDPEGENEALTQQQFKDECDINNIMKRYSATGVLTHLNGREPEFGDFTSPVDFQAGLNTVIEAQAMFADLPSAMRERFANDPLKLLEFLADEKNRDEAVELGLVKAPEPPPEPMAVRVVADPAAAPPPQPKGP